MSAPTANVTLTIGARAYTVSCTPGDEGHVMGLGRIIAAKLDAMPNNIALGEARALLFASLLLADELHDLRKKNRELAQREQASRSILQAAPPAPAPAPASGPARDMSPALDMLAQRLEKIASALESDATSA